MNIKNNNTEKKLANNVEIQFCKKYKLSFKNKKKQKKPPIRIYSTFTKEKYFELLLNSCSENNRSHTILKIVKNKINFFAHDLRKFNFFLF